jgi:multidrug resistance efflux pump
MRSVATSRNVPGRFELATQARQDYAAPLDGLLTLHVNLHDEVTTGQRLFSLDSQAWRELKQSAAAARARVAQTSASVVEASANLERAPLAGRMAEFRSDAGLRHKDSLRLAVDAAAREVEEMANIHARFGGKQIELNESRTRLANAKASLREAEEESIDQDREILRLASEASSVFRPGPVLMAELEARRSEWTAAQEELESILQSIHALRHYSASPTLHQDQDQNDTGPLVIRSRNAGIVRGLTLASGSRVGPPTTVLMVVDRQGVVFRSIASQADQQIFRPGQRARIYSPDDASRTRTLPALVGLSPEASFRTRSFDLLLLPQGRADWAVDGVGAEAEVTLSESEETMPTIPRAALTRDGLQQVYFLRDRSNPDKVIRQVADPGPSNEDWISLESGVSEGDEVVVGGLHQLKIATQLNKSMTGHFHADGTYHEGED